MRWCLDWLAPLERGEMRSVSLHPDTADKTEFIQFHHARVRRVLTRIAADSDASVRQDPGTGPEKSVGGTELRTRQQRGLAEADEKPRGRIAKEPREVWTPCVRAVTV
jgi:hypothetical protein